MTVSLAKAEWVEVGARGGHAPSIGYRLADLKVGQPVRLTVDGRSHELTVQRPWRGADGGGFGSADHSVVTVGFGPGRWNTEVSGAGISAGRYVLEVQS